MPAQATQFDGLLEAVPDALVGVDRSGQVCFTNHLADSKQQIEYLRKHVPAGGGAQ